MARSMTAYGRAHVQTNRGPFLIEIHSVNRKNLDIQVNFPKELLFLEMEFRSRLTDLVRRGYITIRITKDRGEDFFLPMPSLDALKKVHVQWKTYAKELGFDSKEAIPFSTIMQFVLSTPFPASLPDQQVKKELFQGFDKAMTSLIEMKKIEGQSLIADMSLRLDHVEKEIQKMKRFAKEAPKNYHDRLVKKLQELDICHQTDEDRLTREVVLFADRIDVTEELIRLFSHTKQFKDVLKKDEILVGKELDFLAQEMYREANTIAAKSQELKMTQSILRLKSALEKIREQLANIE